LGLRSILGLSGIIPSQAFDRPVLQIAWDFLMASGEITDQQAAEHL
jgi:hypothetical protein